MDTFTVAQYPLTYDVETFFPQRQVIAKHEDVEICLYCSAERCCLILDRRAFCALFFPPLTETDTQILRPAVMVVELDTTSSPESCSAFRNQERTGYVNEWLTDTP